VGIPTGIEQSVSEPGEDKYKDQDWIRRVNGDHDVRDQMASRSNKCHSSLTEMDMDEVVQGSASDIADEWRQEH
jgi:hypothetical protein